MDQLRLPKTFEESRNILELEGSDYFTKLAQFVQPVESSEQEIVDIVSRLEGNSGRMAILLGKTGTGKSTFIQSLEWRRHLGLARVVPIDCSEFPPSAKLSSLFEKIKDIANEHRQSPGLTSITIDYLESLGDNSPQENRSFFQSLNGIFRKTRLLVLWPVTSVQDARKMVKEASAVSSTMFDEVYPIINFSGPNPTLFPAIAKNTISVFNDGKLLQSFLFTEAELDKARDELISSPAPDKSIRAYLRQIQNLWNKKSGNLDKIRRKLPKPNEVWIIFCYPEAEDIVSAFATKGTHSPSAWIAYHAKLWEYVPNTQRESRWKTPMRLQYAIGGAITARILYLPPQALIATCASYSTHAKLLSLSKSAPSSWKKKSKADDMMKRSPLHRQLCSEAPSRGKTKGGPAAVARKTATPLFNDLNKIVAGSGNDRHIHAAIAACLQNILPQGFVVTAEKTHPWIPQITPDIRIDKPDGTQICIEFCYTKDPKPSTVADYVLDKLSNYMDQLEHFVSLPMS